MVASGNSRIRARTSRLSHSRTADGGDMIFFAASGPLVCANSRVLRPTLLLKSFLLFHTLLQEPSFKMPGGHPAGGGSGFRESGFFEIILDMDLMAAQK